MTAARTPKAPQDHKPKAGQTSDPSAPFTFEEGGKSYTLASPDDVLTAGFARRNRHKSADEQLFLTLEALADDETLAAIDSMKPSRYQAFAKEFFAHMGVTPGESVASPN